MFHSVKHDNNDIINVLISLWVIAFHDIVCLVRRMRMSQQHGIQEPFILHGFFDSPSLVAGGRLLIRAKPRKIQYFYKDYRDMPDYYQMVFRSMKLS